MLFLVWWGLGLLGAHLATGPKPSEVPPRTQIGGHAIEAVTTTTEDGVAVKGWLVRGRPSSEGCVVLAAGIRGNRTAMVDRAAWYLGRGWSTLLVDLRGTGESAATRITMGWHEARDLRAWATFLGANGFLRIAVHGQSLGAAAAVYTAVQASPPAWHFVVLEACYADIHEAVAARLPVPSVLAWPLVVCSEWLLGIDADDLVPVRAIARLQAATFLITGALDEQGGADAAARLLAACGATKKQRYEVPDVGHIDLWPAGGDGLRRRLAGFLSDR